MELIALPLSIAISLLWYMPGIRAQGDNKVLQRGDYLKTAFIYGLLYSCLLIIVTEVAWDAVLGQPAPGDLRMEIITSFFRAALLEEFFKLTGFLLAKRAIKPWRKIDYIMIAGMIGLVYGVVEKAVLGNAFAVIIGLAIPMHILWQFNQGGHYFEYERAKAENNRARARKELFMAVAVPFLLHGLWDSALSAIEYLVNVEDSTQAEVAGGVLMVVTLVAGVVYTVRTIKRVRRVAREAPRA